MPKRYRIQFPKTGVDKLNQDEAYFYLQGSGGQWEIRFHDYDEIYQVQGLYEQLFYDCLKCTCAWRVIIYDGKCGPEALTLSVPDFYGVQLCIVMHCCVVGATGAPVNAN